MNIRQQLNQDNSVGITPGEIAYTVGDADRHIIGNAFAPICINMAVYNPQTKQLAFAHFEPFSIDAIDTAIQQIHRKLGGEQTKLLVYFGSGTPRSEGNKLFNRLFGSASKLWQVAGEITSTSMAFNSRTGQLIESASKEELGNLNVSTKERSIHRRSATEYGSRQLNIVFDAVADKQSRTITAEYRDYLDAPVLTTKPTFGSQFKQVFARLFSSNTKKNNGEDKPAESKGRSKRF